MSCRAALAALAAMLSACSSSDMKADNAEIIHRQIGRFAIVPAADGYPPLVLDTAGGCVMAISKDTSGQVTIDELNFPDNSSSCAASKQLLVADTLSRVVKQ